MADTKWLDPANWTLADWEDETKRPLYSHLWDTLKGAADERVSFSDQTHDSGFTASSTFPDFNQDKSIFISSANTPNNATRIQNACYPKDCIDSADMVSGTTIVTTADLPQELSLSDALDDLSYTGDTKMLHMEDTTDGTVPAVSLMAWAKQWYQILDFPVWYNRLRSGGDPTTWLGDVEYQYTRMWVTYQYNQDTSTFTSVEAKIAEGTITTPTTTDVYTANDLNESSPFSTPQDCRDYAISKFNANEGTYWASSWPTFVKVGARQNEASSCDDSGNVVIAINLYRLRIRFKTNQEYRASSPNRYTPEKYFLGYWIAGYPRGAGGAPTFSAFGTGNTEDESHINILTADGSGWHTLEVTGIDYDTEATQAVPATPVSGTDVNSDDYGLVKSFLTPNMTNIDDNTHSIYFKPNLTDGTAWEWYTPAPAP
jgi:hypothetical protein